MDKIEAKQKRCKHKIIEFAYVDKRKLIEKGTRCQKCELVLKIPKYEEPV